MEASSRHTVFIEKDQLVGPSPPPPSTIFRSSQITKRSAMKPTKSEHIKQEPFIKKEQSSPVSKPRIVITNTTGDERLVPEISGSPWKHYKKKYIIKHWYPLGVITARTTDEPFMIRTITGPNIDQQVDNICRLTHPNIIVSGAKYLLEQRLILEDMSCSSIMVTFKGEVKIGNIEHCKHDGSLSQFSESFSRIVMNLMDKTRPRSGPIGLTNLDHWSAAAFNFFTFTTSLPSLDKLQAHSFLENRRHQDLLWVIPYVLVSSRHFLDEFDDENMKEGGVPSEGSLN
uniref:Uncharacterized protein n=1 Tax=Bionectria ochroleuca TaxID=29856 RepID=A0A0B7KJC1_BIOOC